MVADIFLHSATYTQPFTILCKGTPAPPPTPIIYSYYASVLRKKQKEGVGNLLGQSHGNILSASVYEKTKRDIGGGVK